MRDFPFVTGARPDPPSEQDYKYELLPVAGAAVVAIPEEHDNSCLFQFPPENQEKRGVCVGMAVAGAQQVAYRQQGLRFSPSWAYAKAQLEDYVPDNEEYEGTTLRAGLKGWHKHQALKWESWPFNPDEHYDINAEFPCSVGWPLTRYERLDIDLLTIQLAVLDHGCVLVTSEVHTGWRKPNRRHRIKYSPRYRKQGWHAWLISGWTDLAGYFKMRNSWGTEWGDNGYAWIKYDEVFALSSDMWVAIVDA
jgi:hypothetical protein